MQTLSRMASYAKRNGVGATVVASARHLSSWFVTREEAVITCTSLEKEPPEIPVPGNVTFRRAGRDDLPDLLALARQHRWGPSERECRQWLEEEDFVLFAFLDGQPIGYCCVTRDIHPDGRAVKGIRYDSRDGWGRDAFILPSHRGGWLYPALAVEILRVAAAEGYRRIFGRINQNNLPSRSAHRKIGAEEIREVDLYQIRLFGLTLARIAVDRHPMEG